MTAKRVLKGFLLFLVVSVNQVLAEHPSSQILDRLNPASGAYAYSRTDIEVPGPVPLIFRRTYSSDSVGSEMLGLGHSHSLGLALGAEGVDEHGLRYRDIDFPGGQRYRFLGPKKRKNGVRSYYIDPSQWAVADGNRRLDEPSRFPHIKNCRLTSTKHSNEKSAWVVTMPDGTERQYGGDLLREERLPTGNRILYSYDKQNRLTRICAWDHALSIELGSLDFDVDPKSGDLTITGSNGHWVRYQFTQKGGQLLLQRVEKSHGRTERLHYRKVDREGRPFVLSSIEMQGGQRLEMVYSKHYGWLSAIRVPQARKPGLFSAYRIRPNHDSAFSDCTGPLGGVTRYWVDGEARTDRVERLDEQGNVVSAKNLEFVEHSGVHEKRAKFVKRNAGQVCFSGISDAHGVLLARSYHYDQWGNLSKERLLGDLSGDLGRDHIKLGDGGKPIKGKSEYYSSKYRYSDDDRHLLLEEWDDLGTRVQYHYESERPLRTAKFVFEDGRCCRRSFFSYDKLGLLREELHDDGDATDKDSLEGVTQRTRRRYRRQLDPTAPGFGLPLQELDCYYDLSRGLYRTIKRSHLEYDADSRLILKEVFGPKGERLSCESFTYDEQGNVLSESDPSSGGRRYSYDEQGNQLQEQRLGCGCLLEHEYDARGQRIATTETDCDGSSLKRRTFYNALGLPSAEIDVLGRRTDYSYDTHGRLIRKEGPKLLDESGKAYRPSEDYVYDAADRVVECTDHTGAVHRYRYNARDQKTEEQHPNGSLERWSYTLDGRLARHIHTDESAEEYSYDRQGRITRVDRRAADDSLIAWEVRTYSALHLIESESSSGLKVSYGYNARGQLVEKLSEGPGVFERIQYRYDALERVISERLYASAKSEAYVETQKRYDDAGRVIENRVIDALGNVQAHVRYSYDAHGRRSSCSRAVDADHWDSTHSRYDCHGRLVEQQLADGTTEQYSYNKRRRNGVVIEEQCTLLDDGSLSIRGMDAQGRELALEIKDAQGQRCSLKTTRYDQRGLKTREAYEVRAAGRSLGWKIFEYRYDDAGQLVESKVTEADRGSLSSSWDYDEQGQLLSSRNELGEQLDYQRNAQGMLIAVSSPAAVNEAYSYDEQQRLVQFEDKLTGQCIQRDYDAFGRLSRETLPTGQTLKFSYNGYGKLRTLTLPTGERLRYRYRGAFLTHIDRLGKDGEICYRYSVMERDMRGRILKERLPGTAGTIIRSWDGCNRPTAIQHAHWAFHVGSDAYGLDGRLQSCSQGHDGNLRQCSYEYDALGQLCREQSFIQADYSYNSIGQRLAGRGSKLKHSCFPNGRLKRLAGEQQDIKYGYNARQQLCSVTVNDSDRYSYNFDPDGRRLSRTHWRKRTSGGWARISTDYYIYYGQHEIGLLSEQGKLLELRVLANPDDNLMPTAVAIELHGRRYVPINDAVGSVRYLLDMDTGRPIEAYDYSAFGESRVRTLREPASPNLYRFQSQRWDESSASYAYPQRNYIPQLGRWSSPDPLGSLDGPNPYAFVHNRPLSELDPFGLWGVSIGIGGNGDGWKLNFGVHPDHGGPGYIVAAPLSLVWETANWMGVLGTKHTGTIRTCPNGQPATILKEASDGSCIYTVPGKSLSRGAILHCNGMITDFEYAYMGAQWVSDVSGGYEVIAVHNQTHGFFTDLAECMVGLGGHATEPAYLLASVIESFHAMRPADHKLFLSAHSQGSIHSNLALRMLSKEARDRVIAVSIGPAWPIDPAYCYEAQNFASGHDPIPSLRPLLQAITRPWTGVDVLTGNANPHLSRCAKHPQSPAFYDHKLWSHSTQGAYVNALMNYISEFDR